MFILKSYFTWCRQGKGVSPFDIIRFYLQNLIVKIALSLEPSRSRGVLGGAIPPLHHSIFLEAGGFWGVQSPHYHVITVCQQWFITCKTKEHIPDRPNNEQNRIKFLILLFKH